MNVRSTLLGAGAALLLALPAAATPITGVLPFTFSGTGTADLTTFTATFSPDVSSSVLAPDPFSEPATGDFAGLQNVPFTSFSPFVILPVDPVQTGVVAFTSSLGDFTGEIVALGGSGLTLLIGGVGSFTPGPGLAPGLSTTDAVFLLLIEDISGVFNCDPAAVLPCTFAGLGVLSFGDVDPPPPPPPGAVPLPMSLALFGSGLLGFAAVARRR